jgi:bifunctional DNA-binding transcriptional regulator/antitoxin component of YhaV-PrlF toxin-antitoxin module
MVTKVKAKTAAKAAGKKPAKKAVATKAVKKAPVDKAKKSARAGRTSTSKLSSKNQLTVPVDILRSIGLTTGDEVEFTVNDAGFIEVKPVVSELNPVLELAGKYSKAFKNFDLAKEREGWVRSWEK